MELAKRYRGAKGFCLADLSDLDLIENIEAAAIRKAQPLMIWEGDHSRVIGLEPSQGNREALAFALSRPIVRAAEFAQAIPDMLIANASTKFRQLWEQGFLLRRETAAESGGVEYGPRVFSHATCHHAPEIYAGFGEIESRELLERFFSALRES